MPILYDLREKPNPNGSEEQQALYPRVVVKGKITTDILVKDIAGSTTFSEGEIVGVMRLLSDKMAKYLNDGYSVELEDIGHFTASLTARPVMDKSEIRAASVSVKGVNFRMSKGLKRKLQSDVERARFGFKKSNSLSVEKRKEIVINYLKENGYITRSIYSRLTGILRSSALIDLNGWVKEGWLQTRGRKSTKVFLLRKE